MFPERQAMHGDPEAMHRFAERLAELDVPDGLVEPPGATSCQNLLPGCSAFSTADTASTLALSGFLTDTADAIAALKAAAAEAAEDYQATDRAGTHAMTGPVFGIFLREE